MTDADTAAAVVAVFVSALTQIGIPGVFLVAWWQERRAHAKTLENYLTDMREVTRAKVLDDMAQLAVKSASERGPVKGEPEARLANP